MFDGAALDPIVLSVVAAVVPTVAYVWLVWRLDRYEKEPLFLLAVAFLWGALPAALLALILEMILDLPLAVLSPAQNRLISASLLAPLVEEGIKGLALLGLAQQARREFDGVLDGIVYGSLVGLGFGMTENLLYFLSSHGSAASWGLVVLGRAVGFGFNHAMFTALTGVGFGLARYATSRAKARGYVLAGLGAALVAHHLHNFFLTIGNLCLVSLVVDWSGVALVFLIVLLSWQRERRWMQRYLPEEVEAGILAAEHLGAMLSPAWRLGRAWREMGLGGWRRGRLWRRLVDDATELAYKKRQAELLGPDDAIEARIASLRSRIQTWSARLAE